MREFRLPQRWKWDLRSFPTYRDKVSTLWPLQIGPTGCPKTSVTNYQSTLRNIPEERRSQLLSSLPPSCDWPVDDVLKNQRQNRVRVIPVIHYAHIEDLLFVLPKECMVMLIHKLIGKEGNYARGLLNILCLYNSTAVRCWAFTLNH